MTICSNCGNDVGESAFCPNCGTQIVAEQSDRFCPACGKPLEDDTKFCPYCGGSKPKNESTSTVDKIIDIEESVVGKFSKTLNKSKTVDTLIDKTASIRKIELDAVSRKLYEKTEPVFLEVYDSIDDKYLKSIFVLERLKHDNQGGGVIGLFATRIKTPTADMSHEEAITYYKSMLNKIQSEINQEKQNGTFDEDKFYKKKFKESSFDNQSSITGLKFLR